MPAWLLDPTISAIITIVSLVIGVISAIITVIFFFKSRVVAVPKYIIENNKLINLETGGFPEDISMSYKDMQISRLNKTTLLFSNAGRKTIDKSDLCPDYLELVFDENENPIFHIIRVDVEDTSREVIGVKTEIHDRTHVRIYFNYLDFRDFFSIIVFHTGLSIPNQIIGNVKGVPKGLINVTAEAEERNGIITNVLLGLSGGIFSSIKDILKALI